MVQIITSPAKPTQTGPTHLNWSGQGGAFISGEFTPNTIICGQDFPPWASSVTSTLSNQFYLHWVLNISGTLSTPPTLVVNGSTPYVSVTNGGSLHFYTPFISLANTSNTYADLQITSIVGNAKWVLTVSHGCNAGALQDDLIVSKTASTSLTRTFKWKLEKTSPLASHIYGSPGSELTIPYNIVVTSLPFQDSDWKCDGQITIENPNASSFTFDSLSDVISPSDTEIVTVDTSGGIVLAGKSIKRNYSVTFLSNPTTTEFTNTATVNWTGQNTPNTSASDSVGFNFTDDETIINEVNKTITVTDGEDVYTFDWIHQGKKQAFQHEQITTVSDECQTVENTATIDETDQASNTVTTEVCPALEISKSVEPTFTRTYLWKIVKTCDVASPIYGTVGSEVEIPYTITVTPDGYEDSDWICSGDVTITNPNVVDSFPFTSVTDEIVELSTPADYKFNPTFDTSGGSVPSGDSVTRSYSIKFTNILATLTNRAILTWTGGFASVDEIFSFDAPTTEEFKNVTVTDEGVTLGTMDWNEDPKTFTYSKKVIVTSACQDVENIASINDRDDNESSVVIQVCPNVQPPCCPCPCPTSTPIVQHNYKCNRKSQPFELIVVNKTFKKGELKKCKKKC
jgi:hypothetical protein